VSKFSHTVGKKLAIKIPRGGVAVDVKSPLEVRGPGGGRKLISAIYLFLIPESLDFPCLEVIFIIHCKIKLMFQINLSITTKVSQSILEANACVLPMFVE